MKTSSDNATYSTLRYKATIIWSVLQFQILLFFSVCSVLRPVDKRRLYGFFTQNLKFDWSIQITWKRKAAGKSDLFEEAQIFDGTTIPKLTNTAAVIFSYPLGADGLFSLVSSHSKKMLKIDVLKNSEETSVFESLFNQPVGSWLSKRDSDTGAFWWIFWSL